MFSSPQRTQRTTEGTAGMKDINPNSVSSVNSVVKMFRHRDIETQSGREPPQDNLPAFQTKPCPSGQDIDEPATRLRRE